MAGPVRGVGEHVGAAVGIEGEQLVFDYLSKVGDLAHGTSLTAAERARLVGDLRGRIDRMRAEEGGAESKAAVRRILSRLGKPEEVVSEAGGLRDGAELTAPEHRPVASDGRIPGPRVPRLPFRGKAQQEADASGIAPQRSGEPSTKGDAPASERQPEQGASPPHLAGLGELGPEESDPDWWRVDSGSRGGPFDTGPFTRSAPEAPTGVDEMPPGFVGGIELPELWKQPTEGEPSGAPRPGRGPSLEKTPTAPVEKTDEADDADAAEDNTGEAGQRRRVAGVLRGLLRRGESGPRHGGVVELAAVVLLLAGAVLGSLIALGAGWLAAWWAPKFSRAEAKWAAIGMPGLVVAGTAVWLWGRLDGRWGAHLPTGGDALGQALGAAFPVVLRVAAVASAGFLFWRARRPR